MNIPAKVQSLVDAAIDSDASDLHLSAGVPPILRVFGAIRPVPGWDKLTPEEIKEMLNPLLTEAQREELEERGQVDFSFGVRAWALSLQHLQAAGLLGHGHAGDQRHDQTLGRTGFAGNPP